MAEILSQSQIDELLNELTGQANRKNSRVSDEPAIKSYDFKSPKKMSREQNKALMNIADILGRHLAAYLAGVTRLFCEVSVDSIDEHPYYEFNNALPDTVMTAVIDINDSVMLLDMSNSITFMIIEKMLGGSTESPIIPDREFTETETVVMERVMRRVCLILHEALSSTANPDLALRQIETNARFIRAIRTEEVVEVIVYNVSTEYVKGTITICIPYANISALIAGFENDSNQLEISGKDDESKKALLSEFSSSYVDIGTILGTTTLSLQEILNLQPGDVIKLDQKVDNPVLVTVNDNSWFWGDLGTYKSKKAVKFSKYYKGRVEL